MGSAPDAAARLGRPPPFGAGGLPRIATARTFRARLRGESRGLPRRGLRSGGSGVGRSTSNLRHPRRIRKDPPSGWRPRLRTQRLLHREAVDLRSGVGDLRRIVVRKHRIVVHKRSDVERPRSNWLHLRSGGEEPPPGAEIARREAAAQTSGRIVNSLAEAAPAGGPALRPRGTGPPLSGHSARTRETSGRLPRASRPFPE